MKIKDNLDLQGYLLQNFCVDNYDSLDSISNKGDGRMVFLTGNATDAKYRHVNVWDGTNFKALAYLEDVAMNDDFIALQEKVDSIDEMLNLESSQTVIDTWEEVKAFLDSVPEGLELMGLLDDKLSLSQGGRMGASKAIAWGSEGTNSYIFGDNNGLYISTSKLQRRTADARYYDILDTRGGTLTASDSPLALASTSARVFQLFKVGDSNKGSIGYANGLMYIGNDAGNYARIGVNDNGTPQYWSGNNASTAQTLLHSGNVGEYALKNIGATSVAESELPVLNTFGLWHTKGPYIRFGASEAYNITIRSHSNKLQALMNASEDGDWKTIAFTDSDITGNAATATRARYIETLDASGKLWYGDSYKLYGQWITSDIIELKVDGYKTLVWQAKELATPRTIWGQSFDGTADVSGDLHLNAANIYWHNDKTHYCIESVARTDASPYLKIAHYGGIEFQTTGSTRMFINASGNVTIGASDLARENYKLVVSGKGYFADKLIAMKLIEGHGNMIISGNVGIGTPDPVQRLDVNGNILIPNYSSLMSRTTGGTGINLIYAGNDDIIKIGGGILPIKLQGNTTIAGDLHVTGNIIADGEVSAGGAGEEGSGSGSGAGAFHSESIAVGATQKTIAHGLGTDDIVVSIYEKDATSGLWSMILTDIEITDANNIRVTFGSATTVEHKVVIMGAVA